VPFVTRHGGRHYDEARRPANSKARSTEAMYFGTLSGLAGTAAIVLAFAGQSDKPESVDGLRESDQRSALSQGPEVAFWALEPAF
jgi:hypothetical protein